MQRVNSITALRAQLQLYRKQNISLTLVPTMGNLHAGHMALVERAKHVGGRIIVSIFINPSQFLKGEDYTNYPRTLSADLEKLSAAAVDIVLIPAVEEIYPGDLEKHTQVIVPDLDRLHCGQFRPGHFTGVATIVTKLFNIVSPDHAIFGAKDYQQLVMIKRLVAELSFPINIISVPTVREVDGLAISSRNRYLDQQQRRQAPLLYNTLIEIADRIQQGEQDFQGLQRAACQRLVRFGFQPEYVHICDLEQLGKPGDGDLIILASAWLGRARLIDNIPVLY